MEKEYQKNVYQKAEAEQKYNEAKEASARKMDEVKIHPGETETQGDQATLWADEKYKQANWGIEEARGCTGIITSALGGVKDAIADKITQHPSEAEGQAKTGYGLAVNDVGTAVLLVMDDDGETPNTTGAKAE